MTKFTTLAAIAAAGTIAAAPLAAQTTKVATISQEAALFINNKSLSTALKDIDTKYAAQLTAANTKQTALQTQLKPLYDALDTNRDGQLDQNEQAAAVQAQKPQVKQIRDLETATSAEIATSLEPYNTSRLYVFDQLGKRYSTSLDGLIASRQIGLILPTNEAIRLAPATDLTTTVRTEIDKPLLTAAPAGWKPNEDALTLLQGYAQLMQQLAQARAQQAAQQQQQGTAPATAPATGTTPARPARDRNGDPIKK